MKTILPSIIISILAATSACAENYYFRNYPSNNAYWSDVSAWLIDGSDGKVVATRSPNNVQGGATADVYFNSDNYQNVGWHDIVVKSDVNIENLFFEVAVSATNKETGISLYNGTLFTIEGDLTAKLAENATSTGYLRIVSSQETARADLVINGNLNVGAVNSENIGNIRIGGTRNVVGNTWDSPLRSVTIGGNLFGRRTSTTSFNVSTFNQDNSTLAQTIALATANPSVRIAGSMVADGYNSSNPNLFLLTLSNNGSGSLGGVTAFELGEGLSGAWNAMKNDAAKASTNSMSIIILKNTTSQTSNVWLYDDNATDATASSTGKTITGSGYSSVSQVKIIMDGTGTQVFNGERLWFSGGVEVNKGLLKLRMYSTSPYQSTKDIDGTVITGAEMLSMNHGDLTLNGGQFSSHLDGKGVFGFNNINYSGGSYIFGVASGTTVSNDMLILYGTIQKGVNWTEGSKFLIEASGNKDFMLENWVHVFKWDNDSFQTDFIVSDFTSNDYNGNAAQFKIDNDGLWMSYINVPEPATFALLLASLALPLAIYRKRK